MTPQSSIPGRSCLAASAAAPIALRAATGKNIPIGIELFSVRDEMIKDTLATVRAIAKMGYEVVEFYGPYYSWTPEFAKDVRKVMDDTGIRCNSTHNDAKNFLPEGLQKAIDYNKTLGAKYVVMASSGMVKGLDGWKGVGDTLTQAMEKLRPAGLRAGYHNHQAEFKLVTASGPSRRSRPIRPRMSCCNSTSARASKWATTRWRGSTPIRGASTAATSRTGLRARRRIKRRAPAFCLEKAWLPGRRSSPRRRRPVGWNSISSSRKAAATQAWKPPSAAWPPTKKCGRSSQNIFGHG